MTPSEVLSALISPLERAALINRLPALAAVLHARLLGVQGR